MVGAAVGAVTAPVVAANFCLSKGLGAAEDYLVSGAAVASCGGRETVLIDHITLPSSQILGAIW